eukprot:1163484-Pyramimonas_sp.AAC.1
MPGNRGRSRRSRPTAVREHRLDHVHFGAPCANEEVGRVEQGGAGSQGRQGRRGHGCPRKARAQRGQCQENRAGPWPGPGNGQGGNNYNQRPRPRGTSPPPQRGPSWGQRQGNRARPWS